MLCLSMHKRYKIPMEQSKMDNPEKLTAQGTQPEDKQNKNTTQYVFGPHYPQANTTNI